MTLLNRREPILQTARLRLRPLVADDAAALHEAMSDPEVMAHWSAQAHQTPAETVDWVRASVAQAESQQAFDWAIEHNRVIIGRVAFHEPPWIGYFFNRRAWGKGLAYEAIEAVCRYAFEALAWPAVLADVDPANDRNLRMLARIGFTERLRAAATWDIGGRWADSVFLSLEASDASRAVRIVESCGRSHMALARALMREYHAWLGVDLEYQNFDEELRQLPGAYAPPGGAVLFAFEGGTVLGMVAMRDRREGIAEMKRLFVRDSARGRGAGRALVSAVIERARERGYRQLVLDTLPVMRDAQRMYEHLGFRDITSYYDSPVHGTRFLGLDL